MTTKYVWHGGDNTTGNSKSTAYTTVAGAISAASLGSGDIILVHTGTTPHSESAAATMTWTGPTNGAPLVIVGVDMDSSNAYNISSAYNFTTTGTLNDITLNGSFAVYGLWFNSIDDLNLSCDPNEVAFYKDCKFKTPGSNGQDIPCSGGHKHVNCTYDLGASGVINPGSFHEFINPTFIVGTRSGKELILLTTIIQIIGADFTSVDTDICAASGSTSGEISIIGCALHATAVIKDTGSDYNNIVRVFGSDTVSGNNQWRTEITPDGKQRGTFSLSDTVYRDDGATYDGTNEYSFLYTPGTIPNQDLRTYSDWHNMYVAAADGKNIKVYFAATSSQDNSDIYIDVEYFSATGSTIKTVATCGLASPQETPVAHATATGKTWTGITESPSGGQYMTLASTIDIKKSGMLRWRFVCMSTSNIYVCPKAEIV